MRGCVSRETYLLHITALLSYVVAVGNTPSRLEMRLQTIQFFPYHAGLATPHHTRLLETVALLAGSCPPLFFNFG